ncbi:MAG: ferritin-like domain-containing protein [Candidatus Accumulibacter propinquus]|jgi:bacterioferritin|uniref:ferritin-like domain-containing protein n=1 Tax=Candidatus Accumulibacter propinquus TaxID=2954380 RepID=UPI002FC2D038
MKAIAPKVVSSKRPPLAETSTLHRRARQPAGMSAAVFADTADSENVIATLNEALATELVCMLRYKRHQFMAASVGAAPVDAASVAAASVAAEFMAHALDEMSHADLLAGRIVELDGEPNFSPDGLAARSHAEYVEGDSLASMIMENLIAERIAIESYHEAIFCLGDQDPTTRRVLEEILARAAQHAENLVTLIKVIKDCRGSISQLRAAVCSPAHRPAAEQSISCAGAP